MDDANATLAPTNFSLRSLSLFVLVGSLSTGIHYLIMWMLVFFVDLPVVQASAVGFALSAAANYLLNFKFTFQHEQPHAVSAPRFLITAGIGFALNASILSLLIWIGLHVVLAQVLTTVGVIAWNYCIHAYWTFKTAQK